MANETINGNPVSDDQIQLWADEAEAGYPLEKLRKRGRPSVGSEAATVVPVRMDPELLAALEKYAHENHKSRSAVIREAVHAWTRAA